MPTFVDQLNRKLNIPSAPKRIISLVPSQTELLYDLGLRDEVIGITNYCIYPAEWLKNKTHVGGTKKLDFDKIKELQPDLIIGNKEENNQEDIEKLMQLYPVWMSDIYNLKDALNMITCIGTLVEKREEAVNLKLEVEYKFNQLSTPPSKTTLLKTAYLIWRKPYMAASNTTFIDDMLKRCGLSNIFNNSEYGRYPEIEAKQLQEINPDVILLSSEPFPFKEKHFQEFQEICPNAKIMLVDGEMFSWYGSRLLKAPAYFTQLTSELN